MQEQTLSFGEKMTFSLRSLYEQYGYARYKMSKFEEYDLYARNKDFLISDSVITFTDTNGRLMALKPDVTLSIVKNSKDYLFDACDKGKSSQLSLQDGWGFIGLPEWRSGKEPTCQRRS